jgi:hypothetical protein
MNQVVNTKRGLLHNDSKPLLAALDFVSNTEYFFSIDDQEQRILLARWALRPWIDLDIFIYSAHTHTHTHKHHVPRSMIAGRVQVIWQGLTAGSCPKLKVQENFGSLYHTVSKSHWSTPDAARLHLNGAIPATKIVFAGELTQNNRSLW